MDLLEPGGRKFVELGSAPATEEEEEEEGADAAITPRDPEPESRKPGDFSISLFFSFFSSLLLLELKGKDNG